MVEKKYYTVKINALVPVQREFKVFAESPEQAALIVQEFKPGLTICAQKLNWAKIKLIDAKVYALNSLLQLFSKRF